MNIKSDAEKAYKSILKLLKKHKDICVFDVEELERKSKLHLFGLQLKEEYGLNIIPTRVDSFEWQRWGDYRSIGWWGSKYRRTISWSDSGKQPEDELLFCIGFSTGAFIFGIDGGLTDKEYPIKFFQKFWEELKTYKPKYIDSHNNSLYFSMDNAKDIFNNFDDILQKYNNINREDVKQRRIEKMESDLKKLKGE